MIHNTTNEITFDIRKIYEEGYSTKGENRGLGLNNVRKILANYGTMFLETEFARKSFFTSFEDWRIRTRMKIFFIRR